MGTGCLVPRMSDERLVPRMSDERLVPRMRTECLVPWMRTETHWPVGKKNCFEKASIAYRGQPHAGTPSTALRHPSSNHCHS